jgi:hypothetical protein
LEEAYGYIKEGKVFRNAFLEFESKEIGELKESEEDSLKFFVDRFSMAKAKVDQVE